MRNPALLSLSIGKINRFRETIMRNVSIGAWRERTRLGIGLSIIAAGAGLQLLQWLHTSMPG
jgi:hypothetical protein